MKKQKRGKNNAIVGLIFQTCIAILIAILIGFTQSRAAVSVLWIVIAGIPLWFFSVIYFYARQMQRREELELDDIVAHKKQTFFDKEEDQQLMSAQRRVVFLRKWMMPAVTFVVAVFNLVMAFLTFFNLQNSQAPEQIGSVAGSSAFLTLFIFASFLFSRYITGLSRGQDWKPLKAVGGYMLLSSLLMVLLMLGLIFESLEGFSPDTILAWAFLSIQFILGVELCVNLILDIYRPRTSDHEAAPCYESRLLNLIAEPGSVGNSIAETLNYQFGFEVSGTWFYRLISSIMLPLVIFGILVMFALSSLVIIRDGEMGVLKQCGKKCYKLEPGLHVKWPWPYETVDKFPKDIIHEVVVGMGRSGQVTRDKRGELVNMWNDASHGYRGQKELDFLIAATRDSVGATEETTGFESSRAKASSQIQIIKLVASMQYRVVDVEKFNYTVTNPRELVDMIAKQETLRYCASATLTEEVSPDSKRPQAIMSSGRGQAAAELKSRIQKRLDDIGLGAKVTYLGVISSHPPAEVVPAFEDVLKAERNRDTRRAEAEGVAASKLAGIAGDLGKAYMLHLNKTFLDALKELSRAKLKPEQFKKILSGYIDQNDFDINKLRKEIRQDFQLSKLNHRRLILNRLCSDIVDSLKNKKDVVELKTRLIKMLISENMLAYQGFVHKRVVKFEESIAGLIGKENAHAFAEDVLLKSVSKNFSNNYKIDLLAKHNFYQGKYKEIASKTKDFPFEIESDGLEKKIDIDIELAQGYVASILSRARSQSWAKRFSAQAAYFNAVYASLPYQACPQAYKYDKYAEMLEDIYQPDALKYVLGLDPSTIEIRSNQEEQNQIQN